MEEHKTDAKYAELISKATHKYFCVRGERMMFYFHRLKMLDAAPTEILSAIHLWDDIVGWEQSLMGISQYRQDGKINNHMLPFLLKVRICGHLIIAWIRIYVSEKYSFT